MENPDISHIRDWLDTGSINIFGRPFAGKDTQGKLLADLFDGALLGGGDILRGSIVPDHIQKMMHTGELIPTKDYINIVLPYLSQPELKAKPLILSSVGRWHGEEPGVMEAAANAGHAVKAVIYLALSEETVRQRWHALAGNDDRGGRHDDTIETLETRLSEYRDKTLAVLDYYRDAGLLIEIDGNQPQLVVHQSILRELSHRALGI